ncbi:MAG: heat-inducible transcriptional repressor HrcA [Microbacteriaceae bacterium]
MVSTRGLEVLRAIVQDYVASREPVGSKTIVDRHSFGVSAATIRNDMALLEEEELIVAPHTSSGRVPTDKGYRLFVDHLDGLTPLSVAQRTAIESFLDESVDLDDVLSRTVRLLSQLTQQVAMVQYPSLSHSRVRHVELVSLAETRVLAIVITDTGRVDQRLVDLDEPFGAEQLAQLKSRLNEGIVGLGLAEAVEILRGMAERPAPDPRSGTRIIASLIEQIAANRQDRLVIAGAANLARTEKDFTGSIFPVLEAIEQQVVLLRLFAELEQDGSEVVASIGRENASFGLGETSLVTSGYQVGGGEVARLGVLGPTRMDYLHNMAAVRAVARYLSRNLGES